MLNKRLKRKREQKRWPTKSKELKRRQLRPLSFKLILKNKLLRHLRNKKRLLKKREKEMRLEERRRENLKKLRRQLN